MCENDYTFAGRTIKSENKSPLYFCRFLSARGVYLDKRFMQMDPEEWDDKVYCIQVENTNFMVEQNGYSYWTGNCGPTLNLDRVSHKITMLERRGDNFVGKAKILSTPMGKIAESLLNDGVKLGVSSRGVGSLIPTNEGYSVVGEDFMLSTAADIVADPSAPDAFVNGIMEGREWCWDGGILREKLAESTKRRINTLVDQKRLEEQKLNLLNAFLSNL